MKYKVPHYELWGTPLQNMRNASMKYVVPIMKYVVPIMDYEELHFEIQATPL